MTKEKLAEANTLSNKIDVANDLYNALYGAITGNRVAKITIEVDVYKNPIIFVDAEFVKPMAEVVKSIKEGFEKELEKL